MRVTEAQFRIKYDGPDPHYHELDAALLSQALMGFSDMGRAAYRAVHPEETHSLNVKVQALQAGSFEVVLEASVPALEHLAGQVVGFFNRTDVQAAATAGAFTPLLAKAYKLVVWIGGRKYTAKHDGENTTITTTSGDTTVVGRDVYNITVNNNFLTAADQTLAPLADPGYDRMKIQDAAGRDLASVNEEDRGYFSRTPDVREKDETLTIEVTPIQPNFNPASNRQWRFASGTTEFGAKVEDQDFLDKVASDQIPIRPTTTMKVNRREVVKATAEGQSKTSFTIVNVLEVRNQGELPITFT